MLTTALSYNFQAFYNFPLKCDKTLQGNADVIHADNFVISFNT